MLRIYEVLSSGIGTLLFIAITVSISIWVFRHYRRMADTIRRNLQTASKVLEDHPDHKSFARAFDGLSERFHADAPDLAPIWDEFVAYTEGSGRESDFGDQPLLVRRADAHAFFSLDILLPRFTNVRLDEAWPNIVLGTGILGTFVGLVAGVGLSTSHLTDVSNMASMHEGLSGLLGGASTAFWTSVAGLGCSLLLTGVHRRLQYQLRKQLADFADRLNDLIPRETPENLLSDVKEEVRAQSSRLEQFFDDLVVRFGETLGQRLEASIVPSLQSLTDSVASLRDERSLATHETLMQIVDRFEEAFGSAVGEEMRQLGDAFRTIQKDLEGSTELIAASRDETLAALDAGRQHFTEAINQVVNGIHTAVEPLERLTDRWEESLKSSNQVVEEAVQAAQAFEASLRELAGGIEEASENSREAGRQLNEILKNAGELQQEATQAVAELREAEDELSRALEAIDSGARTLQAHTTAITGTWNEQRARFGEVDEKLTDVIRQIHQGLHDYTRRLTEVQDTAHQRLADALTALQVFVERMDERIQDLSELFEEYAAVRQR